MSINQDFLKKLTLLYVEDSTVQRLQTIKVLEPIFKEVIVAVDGKDGLEKYQQFKDKINVIVSDIVMPNITGLQMISLIRKIDSKIPCILTTSIVEPDAFIEAIDLNVTHYAIKPFDYKKLIEQLQSACISTFQDKLLKQKEQEWEQFLNAINGVAIVSKTDLDGNIIYVNSMFCEISGYDPQELVGQPHSIVRHPDVSTEVYKDLWDTIQAGKKWEGIIKNKAKDGSEYYVKAYVFPIFNENLEIKEFMAVRISVTSEEAAKRELRKGLIKNLNTQKMTTASIKKENELLKEQLHQIESTNSDSNSYLIKQKLEEEQQKNKMIKTQLLATEERLKKLQDKYDKFVQRAAR